MRAKPIRAEGETLRPIRIRGFGVRRRCAEPRARRGSPARPSCSRRVSRSLAIGRSVPLSAPRTRGIADATAPPSVAVGAGGLAVEPRFPIPEDSDLGARARVSGALRAGRRVVLRIALAGRDVGEAVRAARLAEGPIRGFIATSEAFAFPGRGPPRVAPGRRKLPGADGPCPGGRGHLDGLTPSSLGKVGPGGNGRSGASLNRAFAALQWGPPGPIREAYHSASRRPIRSIWRRRSTQSGHQTNAWPGSTTRIQPSPRAGSSRGIRRPQLGVSHWRTSGISIPSRSMIPSRCSRSACSRGLMGGSPGGPAGDPRPRPRVPPGGAGPPATCARH